MDSPFLKQPDLVFFFSLFSFSPFLFISSFFDSYPLRAIRSANFSVSSGRIRSICSMMIVSLFTRRMSGRNGSVESCPFCTTSTRRTIRRCPASRWLGSKRSRVILRGTFSLRSLDRFAQWRTTSFSSFPPHLVTPAFDST